MRVSGKPGLNPVPPLWATGSKATGSKATGWRTGSGTLTLTLSRGERGWWHRGGGGTEGWWHFPAPQLPSEAKTPSQSSGGAACANFRQRSAYTPATGSWKASAPRENSASASSKRLWWYAVSACS